MRSISAVNHKHLTVDAPEVVKAMALVIQTPARPALSCNFEIEDNIAIKTAKAPRTSKLNRSHMSVIQNVYHIYILWVKMRQTKMGLFTLVVTSILRCRLSRKRFSAEKARTVAIPSRSSPKSEKMGDLELDSIRRRSRPVLRYPIASSRYANPINRAGMKNQGKTKLKSS